MAGLLVYKFHRGALKKTTIMNCTPIVRHHRGKKPASYQLLRTSSMLIAECGLIFHAEEQLPFKYQDQWFSVWVGSELPSNRAGSIMILG